MKEYIEKDKLIEALKAKNFCPIIVQQTIEDMPTANVKEMRLCSHCGSEWGHDYNYCPNCGNKMNNCED